MSRVDHKHVAVAGVYSRSLLELAGEHGDALLEELEDLMDLVDRMPELEELLRSPLVETSARAELLERWFRGRASDLFVDAVQVINRKGRLDLLPTIVESYRRELRDIRGRVEAKVTTALPLDRGSRARLVAAIEGFSRRAPELTEVVDKDIVGGMVLHIAGRKVDASVKHQIGKLRAVLRERSAAEIQRRRTRSAASA